MSATTSPSRSLHEVLGWASLALRVTHDGNDDPIEPGSLADCELEAIARVLADVWPLIGNEAREHVCERLAEVWPPTIVANINAVIAHLIAVRTVDREIAELRSCPKSNPLTATTPRPTAMTENPRRTTTSRPSRPAPTSGSTRPRSHQWPSQSAVWQPPRPRTRAPGPVPLGGRGGQHDTRPSR